MVSKARRFDGENTWFYFLWYGLGRFWIEGLRTDSLYLFDWTFLGQPIRVSQALSLVLAAVPAVMLFYNIQVKKHARAELWVNQVAWPDSRRPKRPGPWTPGRRDRRGRPPPPRRRKQRGAGGPAPSPPEGTQNAEREGDRWQRALTERPWRPRSRPRSAEAAKGLSRQPGLAVILVGNDPASRVYVNGKERDCAECGFQSFEHALPEETAQGSCWP